MSKPPLDLPPTPKGLPRDMQTEILPFGSKKIDIKRSPIVMTLVFMGMLTAGLFFYLSKFGEAGDLKALDSFVQLSVLGMLALTFMVLFLYSKTDKPIWVFLFPMVVVYFILTVPLIGRPFFLIFREILPGNWAGPKTDPSDTVRWFIGMFFGAGLMEELMKGVAALFAAWLSMRPDIWKSRLPPALYEALRIRGPLDGVMYGIAAGVAFTFIETGGQYVMREIAANPKPEVALIKIMLMIPRVLGDLVGHTAYNAVMGYFIGLCVLRPQLPKYYILIGWVVAATLHAIWNTLGNPQFAPAGSFIAAGLSAFVFGTFFLKARQLHQASGASRESYGSIVVDPANLPARPSAAPVRAEPAPMPPPMQPVQAATFALMLNGVKIPLRSGQKTDFASASVTEGVSAEVSSHPSNPQILGLKNLGTGTWTVTLPTQAVQAVASGRNVRLVMGMRIEFAPGVTGSVIGA